MKNHRAHKIWRNVTGLKQVLSRQGYCLTGTFQLRQDRQAALFKGGTSPASEPRSALSACVRQGTWVRTFWPVNCRQILRVTVGPVTLSGIGQNW